MTVTGNWFKFDQMNELDEAIVHAASDKGFSEDVNCAWRFFYEQWGKQVASFFLNEWQSKLQYTNHTAKIINESADKEEFLTSLRNS